MGLSSARQLPKLWKALQQGKPLSEAATQKLRTATKTEPKVKPEATVKPEVDPSAKAKPVEGELVDDVVDEPEIRNEPDPEEPETFERDKGVATQEDAGRIVESIEKPTPADPTTNINFERMDTVEDLDSMIDEASEINLEAGQHPPRDSLAAMEGRAEEYSLQDIIGHDPVKKGVMLPEKAVASRNLLVELGEKLFKQAKAIKGNGLHVTDDDLFDFRQNVGKYRAVLAVVEGQTRLAGQLLGSFRIPAKNKGMVRDFHVSEMMEEMGGRDVAMKLADNIAMQTSLKGVTDQAKQGWLAKSWRVLEQFRYNAMLSGPDTHLRNFIGNSAALLGKIVETPFVSAVGKARKSVFKAKDVGPSEDYVRMTESIAQLMALPVGAIDGMKLAWKSLKDPNFALGAKKTGNELDRRFALSNSEWSQTNPIAKGVAFLVDVAFINGATRALTAGDNFFKAMAYQMEKSSLALRRGMNEGLTGDELITRVESLMKSMPAEDYVKALDEMHIATFTKEMQGDFIKSLQQGINRTPGASIIVPFFGTLVNLASWTARRSPIAPLTTSFRRAMAKGGIEADKALGQAIAGTMLVALPTWQMVREKRLTGAGSFLSKETKMNWFKAGWRPNSIIDDDGVYHSISGGAPFTSLVLYFATMAELSGFIEDENVRTDVWLSGAVMFGDILLDQTFARGIAEWMDAVSDPAAWKSSALARSTAGSFVPNWLRTIRKFVDPDKRETNLGDFSERLTAEFMNRVPGLSDNLPPAVTYFGEKPEIGYDTIMVFPESSDNKDMYLYHNLDRNGYAMKKPKPVISVNGEKIDLNTMVPDERGEGYAYYQYQIFLGQARKSAAKRTITSSAYQNAPWGKAGEGENGKPTRGDIIQAGMNGARMDALAKMEKTYTGTRLSELAKAERTKGTQEVHPIMPHVARDLERQGVKF